MAISPASILSTDDSLSSKTGGRFFTVRRSAPRRLWMARTTPSLTCRFTFFISTRTAPRSAPAAAIGRGESEAERETAAAASDEAASEGPGEACGEAPGAGIGGTVETGGETEEYAEAEGDGGTDAVVGGTDVRAACLKHPESPPPRTTTTSTISPGRTAWKQHQSCHQGVGYSLRQLKPARSCTAESSASPPKARAVCSSSASTDPCGGRRATGVPTAIEGDGFRR